MARWSPDNQAVLLGEIKERIRSAQCAALRPVNKKLIALSKRNHK
jgi:hypothetical protein